MKNQRGFAVLWAMLGVLAALSMALTTDQIIEKVYDSSNTAMRVNVVAGSAGGGGLTIGTTTITGGTNTRVLYDDGGNVGETSGMSYDKATSSTTFGGVLGAANTLSLNETANCITAEGTSADTAELRFCLATGSQPVNDVTVNVPFNGGLTTRTVATLEEGNTWTGGQTFNATSIQGVNTTFGFANTTTIGAVGADTALTPDAWGMYTGSLGNSVHMHESADFGFDFNNGPCGTSACTDPTFVVHSHNQSTSEYVSISHDGTKTNIQSGTGPVNIVSTFAAAGLVRTSNIRDNGSSTSFTFANYKEICGAAAGGTVTGTLPASPTVGDTYILIQRNATQSCVVSRAGSQTIDGATSATISAGVGIGKECVLTYIASNDWHASGACT